jgi:cytochrome P450
MTTIERYVRPHKIPAALDLPPGPKPPSAVQTILFLGLWPYVAPRWQRRYGDVFSVHTAPAGRGIVLTRPEHIREVFAGSADAFHAGEGNAILGPIMGQQSVLLLDEDAHRESRRKVMAAFHGEAMRHWAGAVEQVAADDIATWPLGVPFPVHQHLNDISLEVILRIVFGVTDARRLSEMRPLLGRLVRIDPVIFVGWMYPALQRVGPWRRFQGLKHHVDELVYAEIADRRTVPDLNERRDVLSKLLVADPQQTDHELRDHLITLLLAGHETTASTLAWVFHDLEAVVKEGMRLRPVIGSVARRLAKPATVAGYDLPRGVVIYPSIQLVHRREDVFDDATGFRPERFLGQNPPPATWIPFGGGIRRCLGASLAMVESVGVLKTVLRLVEIAPAGPSEMSKTRNITTVPARGARIVAFPR